jgi:hypothetical protein
MGGQSLGNAEVMNHARKREGQMEETNLGEETPPESLSHFCCIVFEQEAEVESTKKYKSCS